jgi:hypothetical protein
VLRELESLWFTPNVEPPTRRADGAPAALRPAGETSRGRGFEHEPFGELDPSAPPYRAAPFDSLRRELSAMLETPGATVLLAGAPRSGRTTLARRVFAANAERGAYVDLALTSARPGSVARRIARAFGGVASSAAGGSAELEGLLEALADAKPHDRPRLIVVDGAVPGSRATAEVAALARAARSTRYFSLLIVGPAELAPDLIGPRSASSVITVPPLTTGQVAPYLTAWLTATRSPIAPPLIITIDAALLIAHRTEGNLGRINALAREMIAGGAGAILTSWDAWSAPDGIGHGGGDRTAPPARPEPWPPPEILAVINQCRAAAGLAVRGVGD